MSEICKVCKNCNNSYYGFGESSLNYGMRCNETDYGVDENFTCDSWELAISLKYKELQQENQRLKEELERIKSDNVSLGYGKGDCSLSDLDRTNGTLCRSMYCTKCPEFRSKTKDKA